MGNESNNNDTVLYAKSSDFKEGESGYKIAVVKSEEQLKQQFKEAGLDEKTASQIWKNTTASLVPDPQNEFPPVALIVKDANGKIVRVFGGDINSTMDYYMQHLGKGEDNVKPVENISLRRTVDMKHPTETSILKHGSYLTLDPFERGPTTENADKIEKAITSGDVNISKAPQHNGVEVAKADYGQLSPPAFRKESALATSGKGGVA